MNDIDNLIVSRYDEQIYIYDDEQLVFKGFCDEINITEKVEEMYATTVIKDKPSYISSSTSIEGKIKISAKNNSDISLLLECIKQNKKLTLHYRNDSNEVCVIPFNGYNYYNNVFTYDIPYIINFFAKEIITYSNETYHKNFNSFDKYDEYENDFKNRIKAGAGVITDINKVEIIFGTKAVTWDDISSIQIGECEEKIQNEYCEEVVRNKGYYFRFYTRQDVFRDEFYGDNSDKLFQIFYKDKNETPYILWGYIDYINIQEDMNDLGDSYIQIFLKHCGIRENKAALIKQACNLKKEDVEQLEKTLLTNDCILQPLTQSTIATTATIVTGGFMENSICSTYDPSFYIRTSEVTIGDKNFKTTDLANALDKIVNNDKIASSTTKKEDKSMFNKIFDKYKFGEVKTNNIAYTINGLAFKGSDGTYAVYKDGTLTNVGDMIIDMPIFIMPTSLKSIEIGDVIVHYGAGSDVFVIVTAIDKDNITVVDPWSKERKNLIPEKSFFGFDFVAKVITPMGMFEKQANADNPFGNMLPFMMMGDGDNKDIMMLMMMSQGNINNQMLPLMFMGKGNNDMFKYMMFAQMNGTTAGIDKE